ncbi:GNAT family N-acetyltransferase [Streptomyces sp. NPDC005548]|uniref:GNAT family N-acetyltransferase n=1 Tax=Streptomyces sp. NPDC005548 TaxID=3364724 RepID=UPI0036AC6F2B
MTGPARPPAVHSERVAASTPAGLQAVLLRDVEGRAAGRVDFQVCHCCGLGYVESIVVAAHWQGQGVGRRAIQAALGPCMGYAWSTSRQTSEGRRFFAAMQEETGLAFPAGAAGCTHMLSAHRPGLLRGLLTQHRP